MKKQNWISPKLYIDLLLIFAILIFIGTIIFVVYMGLKFNINDKTTIQQPIFISTPQSSLCTSDDHNNVYCSVVFVYKLQEK